MMPALSTAAFVFVAYLLGCRLVNAAYAPADRRSPPWRRGLAFSLLIGAVIFAASAIDPAGAWYFGAITSLAYTAIVAKEVEGWRRFFRDLDDACARDDVRACEAVLTLRHPPTVPRAYTPWVNRIIVAAGRAHESGLSARGLSWLDAIDLRRIARERTLVVAQSRAALALASGQVEVARETLRMVPSPVGGRELEEAFGLLRALLSAIDGECSDDSLAAARASRSVASVRAADAWAVTEAHILAARGDESAAHAILRELGGRARGRALERCARHGGPASALAQRLVTEEGPYR